MVMSMTGDGTGTNLSLTAMNDLSADRGSARHPGISHLLRL